MTRDNGENDWERNMLSRKRRIMCLLVIHLSQLYYDHDIYLEGESQVPSPVSRSVACESSFKKRHYTKEGKKFPQPPGGSPSPPPGGGKFAILRVGARGVRKVSTSSAIQPPPPKLGVWLTSMLQFTAEHKKCPRELKESVGVPNRVLTTLIIFIFSK